MASKNQRNPPGRPVYSDNLSTFHITVDNTFDKNSSTVMEIYPEEIRMTHTGTQNGTVMSVSSINFSDESGESELRSTKLQLDTKDGNKTSRLTLSGDKNNFALDALNASLDLNVSTLFLSGKDAPTTEGTSVIAQGKNGLQWFTVSDLLSIEAGRFINDTGVNASTGANIEFSVQYTHPPSVVITPSAADNKIVAVSLNEVTNVGFKAIFASSELKEFNFIVLPINSSSSKIKGPVNASSSRLNFSNVGDEGGDGPRLDPTPPPA